MFNSRWYSWKIYWPRLLTGWESQIFSWTRFVWIGHFFVVEKETDESTYLRRFLKQNACLRDLRWNKWKHKQNTMSWVMLIIERYVTSLWLMRTVALRGWIENDENQVWTHWFQLDRWISRPIIDGTMQKWLRYDWRKKLVFAKFSFSYQLDLDSYSMDSTVGFHCAVVNVVLLSWKRNWIRFVIVCIFFSCVVWMKKKRITMQITWPG